jgi:hypothetical protein
MQPVEKVYEENTVLVIISRGEPSFGQEDQKPFYPGWSSCEEDPEIREFMMFDKSLIEALRLLHQRIHHKKAPENAKIWYDAVQKVAKRCEAMMERNAGGSRLDTMIRNYRSLVISSVPRGAEFNIIRDFGEGKEILVLKDEFSWTTA